MTAAPRRYREDAEPTCGRTHRIEVAGFVLSEFLLGADYESAEHAHALPGIVLPVTGVVRMTLGIGSVATAAGDALLLPGGLAHGEHAAAPVRCLLLELGDAQAEWPRLLDRLAQLRHPELAAAARRVAGRLRRQAGPGWEHEYEAVEIVLLVDHLRMGPTANRRASPPWVVRATERLRAEFRAPPTLGEVARDVGVSREHLARQFRQVTGLPAGEFVRRRRVLEAIRLLRDPRLSLAAVAAAAGFADQSHLTRHLRRYAGTTPRNARRLALRA